MRVFVGLRMFTELGNRGTMQMGSNRVTVIFVGMVTMSMPIMRLMLMCMSVTMRVTVMVMNTHGIHAKQINTKSEGAD